MDFTVKHISMWLRTSIDFMLSTLLNFSKVYTSEIKKDLSYSTFSLTEEKTITKELDKDGKISIQSSLHRLSQNASYLDTNSFQEQIFFPYFGELSENPVSRMFDRVVPVFTNVLQVDQMQNSENEIKYFCESTVASDSIGYTSRTNGSNFSIFTKESSSNDQQVSIYPKELNFRAKSTITESNLSRESYEDLELSFKDSHERDGTDERVCVNTNIVQFPAIGNTKDVIEKKEENYKLCYETEKYSRNTENFPLVENGIISFESFSPVVSTPQGVESYDFRSNVLSESLMKFKDHNLLIEPIYLKNLINEINGLLEGKQELSIFGGKLILQDANKFQFSDEHVNGQLEEAISSLISNEISEPSSIDNELNLNKFQTGSATDFTKFEFNLEDFGNLSRFHSEELNSEELLIMEHSITESTSPPELLISDTDESCVKSHSKKLNSKDLLTMEQSRTELPSPPEPLKPDTEDSCATSDNSIVEQIFLNDSEEISFNSEEEEEEEEISLEWLRGVSDNHLVLDLSLSWKAIEIAKSIDTLCEESNAPEDLNEFENGIYRLMGCCSNCQDVVHENSSMDERILQEDDVLCDGNDIISDGHQSEGSEEHPNAMTKNRSLDPESASKKPSKRVSFSSHVEVLSFDSHKSVAENFNPRPLSLLVMPTSMKAGESRLEPTEFGKSSKSPLSLESKDFVSEINKRVDFFEAQTEGVDRLHISEALIPCGSLNASSVDDIDGDLNFYKKYWDSDDSEFYSVDLSTPKTEDKMLFIEKSQKKPQLETVSSKISLLGLHPDAFMRQWSMNKLKLRSKISMQKLRSKISML